MTVALVPVKELHSSKSRLRCILSQRERQALTLAMLEDVLSAICASKGLEGVAVVSRDPRVRSLARSLGAAIIQEPQWAMGEGPAVEYAGNMLIKDGVESVLVLPMDVPLITPDDVETLTGEKVESPSLIISPSKDGGTNAMLQCPPNVIPYHFGAESFGKHSAEAMARGIPLKVVHIPNLYLDIDSHEDLIQFLSIPNSTQAKRKLVEMGVTERLEGLPGLKTGVVPQKRGTHE